VRESVAADTSSLFKGGDTLSNIKIKVATPATTFPPPDCHFDNCRSDRANRIEQAKLEWEFTADSIPQLIFLLDRDDTILRTNRTLEQWGLGAVTEATGRKLHDLLHPICRDKVCRLRHIWKSSVDNMEQDFAVEYQSEDKLLQRYLNLHFHFHRSPHDAGDGFVVAVISDISDIKQAEKKLQHSNEDLELRVEESTFALISTNIRLQQEIARHRAIEAKLEDSREEYSHLIEAMDEGLAILDRQGRITYVNKQFCDTLGHQRGELLGHTPADYIAEDNRIALERHMAERASGGKDTYVANLKGVNGRNFWVKISPTQLVNKTGESTGSFAVIADDIRQLNERQVLRETAKEIDDLYDHAPCGYHTLDSDGVFIKINNTNAKWLGYASKELIGKKRFIDILTPASARNYESYLPRLRTIGYVRDLEVDMVRKNGSILPVLLSTAALRDAQGQFVMSRAIVYDISHRREAEQTLRESEHAKRMLTAQVMSAQEKERKRIASELHDGIGQTLSAIKFYVENAIRSLNEQTVENSSQMFRNVIPKLQDAIEEVRRISMDLRPSLLDDIGTLATLSWFCRQFQHVYEALSIELRIDIEESDIPVPLKVAIFRIVQEAMNNCAKYSKANHIHISLMNTGKEIELAVEDDGQGFDIAEVSTKNHGLGGMGLVSMRERAEFSGGTFLIESAPDRGTSMRVIWPLQETPVLTITD
jgi:PAS domain S-box-containing protein